VSQCSCICVQSYSFSISLLDKCETELYWIIGQDYWWNYWRPALPILYRNAVLCLALSQCRNRFLSAGVTFCLRRQCALSRIADSCVRTRNLFLCESSCTPFFRLCRYYILRQSDADVARMLCFYRRIALLVWSTFYFYSGSRRRDQSDKHDGRHADYSVCVVLWWRWNLCSL